MTLMDHSPKLPKLLIVIYALGLFALSFTDVPLWNDAAHFYYRMLDEDKLYVDPLWGRYSDLLYEVPAYFSLKIFGPSSFSTWIFKLTLLLLPLGLLSSQLLKIKSTEAAKQFVSLNFLVVLPFAMLFPIGTFILSFVGGVMILGALLEETRTKHEIKLYVLGHALIFFGHEFGVLIIFITLAYLLLYRTKNFFEKIDFKKLFLIEILFLFALVGHRLPWWIKNQEYVSHFSSQGWPLQYAHYPFMVLVGLSAFFFKGTLLRILHALIAFAFLYWLLKANGNEFYSSVYYSRYCLFPFALLVFVLSWKNPIFSRNNYGWVIALILSIASGVRAAQFWAGVDVPTEKKGCIGLSDDDTNWIPPDWTVPFLSIIYQGTYKPQMIQVVSDFLTDGECQRFGRHLLIGKDYIYHLLTFNNQVDASGLLESVPQFRANLPYNDETDMLRLPEWGVMEFNIGEKKSAPICLEFTLKSHGPLSLVEVFADNQLVFSPTVEKEITFKKSFPTTFDVLKVHVRSNSQVTIKKVTQVECSAEFH